MPCDTELVKKVKTSGGTTNLYPRQLYCYQSLVQSIKDLVKRPGFIEKCELWRSRKIMENTIDDIYDGKVWNSFLNPFGKPFHITMHYLLMLTGFNLSNIAPTLLGLYILLSKTYLGVNDTQVKMFFSLVLFLDHMRPRKL